MKNFYNKLVCFINRFFVFRFVCQFICISVFTLFAFLCCFFVSSILLKTNFSISDEGFEKLVLGYLFLVFLSSFLIFLHLIHFTKIVSLIFPALDLCLDLYLITLEYSSKFFLFLVKYFLVFLNFLRPFFFFKLFCTLIYFSAMCSFASILLILEICLYILFHLALWRFFVGFIIYLLSKFLFSLLYFFQLLCFIIFLSAFALIQITKIRDNPSFTWDPQNIKTLIIKKSVLFLKTNLALFKKTLVFQIKSNKTALKKALQVLIKQSKLLSTFSFFLFKYIYKYFPGYFFFLLFSKFFHAANILKPVAERLTQVSIVLALYIFFFY